MHDHKQLYWVFYHQNRPDDFQQVYTAEACYIQEGDLDKSVGEWAVSTFADPIWGRYKFDLDATSIQIAKPTVAINAFNVDKKWAKSITDPDRCFQIIPSIHKVKELPEILHAQENPNHLHLIVTAQAAGEYLNRPFKRPRLGQSPPHTPPAKAQIGTVKYSPPRLTSEQTKAEMAAAFEGFAQYVEWLATGKLDGYLDSIQHEEKASCPGIILPREPILLIHNLGKHSDQKRIEQLFVSGTVHLFSVSGSGKTRLSLDGLCHHWGLYISCRTKPAPASGSSDFTVATEMLQSLSSWNQSECSNSPAADRIFAMLLCMRFFILKQLVQQIPINTDPTVARRRWVLAQVLPPHLAYHADDLFVRVLQSLRHADTKVMFNIASSSMCEITTKRKDLFPEESNTSFYVVIDEAQVAADSLKNSFASASGDRQHPILHEMVRFFHSSNLFAGIILSGTGLSMEKVKEAVGSLSAKRVSNRVRVFTDIGCFARDDPNPQVDYIMRYLTLSSGNISDKRLLERMLYWFSGRYRLTASLIEIFLESKDVPRHRVLTLFAERLTGFKLKDAIELEAGEPPVSHELSSKIELYQPLTELDRLFKGPELPGRVKLIDCLVDALMRWTLKTQPTPIPIEGHMHDTIALGIGFLAKMPNTCTFAGDVNYPVHISERLVVLSLSSLFEQHDWTTKKTWIVRAFRNAISPSSLGFVFETSLPLVLMEIFGGKFSPLADAFQCSESVQPMRVTLVSLKRTSDGKMQTCPVSWNAGSSDCLGLQARTPTDVLKFLDNPDGKAFLFPDNHMGPDLLCFVQEEKTKELILLVMQSKVSQILNNQTWIRALNSVTPQFFYTVVAKEKRVQYAPVSYPKLIDDLTNIFKMLLGPNENAPTIVDTYQAKLRSTTKDCQQSTSEVDCSSQPNRMTPRFLSIVATPDDEKAEQKRLGQGADVAVLHWDKVKEYIGSTADSVKNAGVMF